MCFNMVEVDLSKDSHFHGISRYLTSEKAFDVIAQLHLNPYSTASEIANFLGITIATAQTYLEILEKFGIVISRIRPSVPRSAKEYSLISEDINLRINVPHLVKSRYQQDDQETIRNMQIRENARADVLFEYHEDNYIQTVVIVTGGLRRKIKERIPLTIDEGKFLSNIPFQSESWQSVDAVLDKARLSGNP